MTNPLIKLVNATTGVELEREMNAKELESYEAEQAARQTLAAEQAAKEEARSAAEAKLIELGLTTEDLKALLG
jgi:phosphopantetheinyl transferase (holo-ACP synthase)